VGFHLAVDGRILVDGEVTESGWEVKVQRRIDGKVLG
jgi:hypothetical protein